LPPYSSDLKSIEMAFAKLKALLRAKAVRTIGRICDLFDPQECNNYSTAEKSQLSARDPVGARSPCGAL